MMIFLDTCVLLSFQRGILTSLAAALPMHVTAHNYIELLSEVKTNFSLIKGNLSKIENISCDWRLPLEIICEAYGTEYPFQRDITASLQQIVRNCQSSNSLPDFIKQCELSNLRYNLDFFNSYDRLFEIQQKIEESRIKAFKDVPDKIYLSNLNPHEFDIYCDSVIETFAQFYCDFSILPKTDQLLQAYTVSYNGSIDSFIRAYAFCESQKIAGYKMHRNDHLDLMHLLYLGPHPGDSVLLTDDTFYDNLQSVLPCRCFKSKPFTDYLLSCMCGDNV